MAKEGHDSESNGIGFVSSRPLNREPQAITNIHTLSGFFIALGKKKKRTNISSQNKLLYDVKVE